MSELKVYEFDTDYPNDIQSGSYYDKSEADKVIAELEERIADGDKDFEIANNQNERLLKIVRHHKYKRSLANAETCAWAEDDFEDALEHAWSQTGQEEYERKRDFYKRWKNKWSKIADKFK